MSRQNKWSTFAPLFFVLLCRVVVCVIDIFCCSRLDFLSYVKLLIKFFWSLHYIIYRKVLSFFTDRRLLFPKYLQHQNLQQMVYLSNLQQLHYQILYQVCEEGGFSWRRFFSFIKFGFSWIEIEWCRVHLKFFPVLVQPSQFW